MSISLQVARDARIRRTPGGARDLRRRLAAAAVIVAGVAGLAACGGSSGAQATQGGGSGEAAKTPQQILADATVAVGAANSVRVVGAVPNTTTPITVNFALSSARGMTGTIVFNGAPAELVRVGQTLYVRAPLSFYAAIGAPTAAIPQLAGRWIDAPVTSAALAPFHGFLPLTDYRGLWTTVLDRAAKPVVEAGTGTIGAVPVVYLRDAKKNTLAIRNLGTPYPVAVMPPSGQQGQLTFAQWNAPVTIRVPSGAVSLASITG